MANEQEGYSRNDLLRDAFNLLVLGKLPESTAQGVKDFVLDMEPTTGAIRSGAQAVEDYKTGMNQLENPQSFKDPIKGLGNLGLASIGAVGALPIAGSLVRGGREAAEAARMARAVKQGAITNRRLIEAAESMNIGEEARKLLWDKAPVSGGEKAIEEWLDSPATFYHGTPSPEVTAFNKSYMGDGTQATSAREGIFVSNSPDDAEFYAAYSDRPNRSVDIEGIRSLAARKEKEFSKLQRDVELAIDSRRYDFRKSPIEFLEKNKDELPSAAGLFAEYQKDLHRAKSSDYAEKLIEGNGNLAGFIEDELGEPKGRSIFFEPQHAQARRISKLLAAAPQEKIDKIAAEATYYSSYRNAWRTSAEERALNEAEDELVSLGNAITSGRSLPKQPNITMIVFNEGRVM